MTDQVEIRSRRLHGFKNPIGEKAKKPLRGEHSRVMSTRAPHRTTQLTRVENRSQRHSRVRVTFVLRIPKILANLRRLVSHNYM